MADKDVRWMTYAEVRDALGLSSARAALARSRRGNWARRQHNEDKQVRVAVPVDLLAAPRDGSRHQSRDLPPPPPEPAGTVTVEVTGPITPTSDTAALEARLRAAESRLSEALAMAQQMVDQIDQAHRERADALVQVAAERIRADAVQARLDAAQAELADWTAGGPLARAVRAFLNRRGRA